jgi:hypothetical protein
MDCQEVSRLLPDHFHHALSDEQSHLLEEHFQHCVACREEVEVWQRLGSIAEEQPGSMVRRRFEAMLESYQQGRWEQEGSRSPARLKVARWFGGAWFAPRFAMAAAALALIAVGFLAGIYVDHSRTNSKEMAALHRELTSTRQLVALSLLQQLSASDRLQGVSFSTRLEGPDPKVLAALLHTLHYDNSVDVRLAALDALRHYNDQPTVRTGVEDSLKHQRSPLVQIAVVDFLVELRDRSAVEKLKVLQQDPNLVPAVRQRVDWGISQLSRG